MKIGCCVNIVANDPFGVGYERAAALGSLGYDYVELPLAQLMELDESRRAMILSSLVAAGIPCEACNNFFPAHLRLTGEKADHASAIEYAKKAVETAARFGAKVIVFGSSGAKNVPEGFAYERALEQLSQLLGQLSPLLADHGITAVIEPICRLEGNIITTAAEGLELMRAVDSENVRLLVDYYHLSVENEPVDIISSAGEGIRHIHFADPAGRVWPIEPMAPEFFATLCEIGYNERISIEAYSENFEADARLALAAVRRALA